MAKKSSRKRKPGKPWKTIVLFSVLSLIIATGIFFAYRILAPNTAPFHDQRYFYIHTGSSYAQVLKALKDQDIVKSINSFDWLARQADYPEHVKAGRYEIKTGMSNLEIVKLLHSGRQMPVKLVINKLRTREDFVAFVSTRLEADSNTLRVLLRDPVYLRRYGLDTNTALCAVIPNTYEFFWNTGAEDLYDRLAKEARKFWTDKRKTAADSLGLTIPQVYILASIIEEETNNNGEKPLIASVYLNRLRSGMRLSADPTVKFAVGNFSLRRITGKQTGFDSPYNTYLYAGLPPGPICTPSIKTIDAVLRASHTEYLYFCASADFSGRHVFAATYAEHLRNARRYQKALDSLAIH
ncbi:endolytic transglycosylase MltG [Compostibacter hankyongensis]|uniref:Endolytic murein transglycosylase n=1 Tax=Compostibacter hankyongensis TaxID=1007089 RepID=A0ABP8FW41_9BACT